MLLQIRDYIALNGQVSLTQLQREFLIDPEALTPMLALLENKGYIKPQAPVRADCSSACLRCGCDSPENRLYQTL